MKLILLYLYYHYKLTITLTAQTFEELAKLNFILYLS